MGQYSSKIDQDTAKKVKIQIMKNNNNINLGSKLLPSFML